MALIRRLGPIGLPRAYSAWIKRQAQAYREFRAATRINKIAHTYADYPWPKGSSLSCHCADDSPPVLSKAFADRFSDICTLSQQHSFFTLVDVDLHTDPDPGLKGNSILVVYEASPCHKLFVESDSLRLLPGHAYAFNHKREHALLYDNDYGVTIQSKPLSAVKISFHAGEKAQRVNVEPPICHCPRLINAATNLPL